MSDYTCPVCGKDLIRFGVECHEVYSFQIGDPLYSGHDFFDSTEFFCFSCGANVTGYIEELYDDDGEELIEED